MTTRKSPTFEPNVDRRASIRPRYTWAEYTSGVFLPDDLKLNVPEGGVFHDTAEDASLSQSEWVYNNPADFNITKLSLTQ